jgi:4a-hydroxytetrahydrobiopterin dehydratase
MTDLADKTCVPCRGGVPPLARAEVERLLRELDGWKIVGGHHLEKKWMVGSFARALELVNAIGAVAEAEKHHPDLGLGWGWLEARIWTHAIDGLTESDFVLASKIDRTIAAVTTKRA